MKLWALFLISFPLLESDGANILAVLPLPLGSHQNVFRPILKQLVNRGHDVTVITSSPENNATYKQIVLENTYLKLMAEDKTDLFEYRKFYWYQIFNRLTYIGEKSSDSVLKSSQVQEILQSNNLKFDLILGELTFYQEAYVAFGHKFNAPVVELQTMSATFWLSYLISNPYTFSYSVDYVCPLTDKMNFLERLQNTVVGMSSIALHQYVHLPKQQALADKYMKYSGWEIRPPLMELLSNISLVILNTHISTHYPHPNNPNIIEVGGIQIKPNMKLPEELQSYLDNAKEGVVYFSFGSNVQCSLMPENTRQAFISAIAKLPYKVLWKWEADLMPNQPSNVRISKWFPQTEILAHKNVKGFISHGGINSLTESVYHGVPLIIIPIFADQFKNSKQAQKAGYGLILNFDNITEESVFWSVNEITQPSYHEAAKKQSAILRDNPLPRLDTIMYWIEYVIRHKGAPHLRTAATSLSWYQYFLIDVFLVLIAVLVSVLLFVYLLLKAVFKFLCRRKTEKRIFKTSKKVN